MISKCKRNLIITTPLNKPANQIICGFSKPIVFWFVGLLAARKSYPLISKYQLFTISMAPTNKPANQIIFCFSEAIFFVCGFIGHQEIIPLNFKVSAFS